MLNFIKQLWKALNGRKTLIGAVLSALYYYGVGHGLIVPHQSVADALQLVFGVGVVHKGVKWANNFQA